VRLALRVYALAWTAAAVLCAQDIRIYSEFQRFNPFGNPVPQDRDMAPREILSPAMPRNGHLTLHVVITGPAGTNYFLYAGTNPPGIVDVHIYREHFTSCGAAEFCPDWLTEQNSPTFGAIPELAHDLVHPAMAMQTTRCYLFDIKSIASTPPRRVRVEALMKIGTWYVAPMEVRIEAPVVPEITGKNYVEDIAALDAPSSETARIQLLRYLHGLPPEFPPRLLRVRDFIQRNAAEDMLLARMFAQRSTRREVGSFPELNLLSWWPLAYPGIGAEWYLRVRDFLDRFDD
jgi:hypothetical protein